MKKLTTTLLGASLLFTGIASASMTTYQKGNDELSTELCMAIANGDTKDVRSILQSRRLNKAKITDKLHCNDLPASEFSEKYGKNTTKMQDYLKNS